MSDVQGLSWAELRRKALLGAANAQGDTCPSDPIDALLSALSVSFMLTQGARAELEPVSFDPDAGALPPPAPPQLGDHPTRREGIYALLNDGGAQGERQAQTLSLALGFYMCSLAHFNRTLPTLLIAPSLSRLLLACQAQQSSEQLRALISELPFPPEALLSAVGPRGRWLISQDLTWRRAFHELTDHAWVEREVRVARVSPERFNAQLIHLEEAASSSAEPSLDARVRLERLLLLSHPSALRASVKSERVRRLFTQLKIERAPWAALTQDDLIERLDAECRS